MSMRSALIVAILVLPVQGIRAEDREQLAFFEKKIRPVLVQKCYKCHSGQTKKAKGGLLLDTREGIRRGGESGDAVVPGKPSDSLLLDAIRYDGLEMPPNEQLSKSVVADFEKWIKSGAADPRVAAGKPTLIKRKIDFNEARKFWAFIAPKKQAPGAVKDATWARNDIDRFVLWRLERGGLRPTRDADRAVLVRRVYFDLIGLPPTPQQLKQFLDDRSPKALENLIDQLMEQPQFGERWGRHWMDVVRYAESTGMERNYTYPHAWRYRDYVIKSFNADKPFNQFITEQLAGDLLPEKDPLRRNEKVIATGMLAIGTKSLNERNREKFLMDIVDDQIDVTSRAFFGLTASCARCHDHKFDPIPTTDYYALAGIFRSTNTMYGTGGGNGNRQNGRLFQLAKPGGAKSGDAKQQPVAAPQPAPKKQQQSLQQVSAKLRVARRKLAQTQKEFGIAAKGKKKKGKKTKAAKLTAEQRRKLQAAQREVAALTKKSRELRAKTKKRGRGRAQAQTGDLAMAVNDLPNPGDTQVRIRGEVADRGPTVTRGYLTIATDKSSPKINGGSGRFELAQWITSENHPLTSRVAVNRLWQHLFGQGIVRSVNNFGANGDRPSHPELLDHLALKFMDDGWSVKKAIRYMMLSRTYQMASDFNKDSHKEDPENRLLWRMSVRRLDAEAIRDAMLQASGELDLTPAEKSVVSGVGNGDIGRNLQPGRFSSQTTKRSVYLPIVRGVVPEILTVFDFPEPSIIFGRRDETTVPTQALYMMNSPFVVKQAEATAKKILAKTSEPKEQVETAYRAVLARTATTRETARGVAYLKQTYESIVDAKRSNDDEARLRSLAAFCQALFASAEFRYVE